MNKFMQVHLLHGPEADSEYWINPAKIVAIKDNFNKTGGTIFFEAASGFSPSPIEVKEKAADLVRNIHAIANN